MLDAELDGGSFRGFAAAGLHRDHFILRQQGEHAQVAVAGPVADPDDTDANDGHGVVLAGNAVCAPIEAGM